MTLSRSNFRLIALTLGIALVVGTIFVYSVLWVAAVVGLLFGLGGYLFDYVTRSRYAGGQLSSWALAAGGGVVALYWSRALVIEGHAQVTVWVPVLQYVGVVLIAWAALMFGLPVRQDEH